MFDRRLVAVMIAVVVVGVTGSTASAQDCPCDCYFSSDCEGGTFCNWGNLSIEDTCFWRTPKPQGSIGAGCDQDYNDWGQCDGICTQSLALTYFSREKVDDLATALSLWADALTGAARAGGGYPDGDLVAAARQIRFQEPRMLDSMWRVAVEVFALTLGEDFMIYPTDVELFHSEQAQVRDLGDDPQLLELGDLAIKAMLAEIRQAGGGQHLINRIGDLGLDDRLDDEIFQRVCRDEKTRLACLHTRIGDMADAISRGGRGNLQSLGGPTCGPPCMGDFDGNQVIDVDDLTTLLMDWGNCPPAPDPCETDLNGNGRVEVDDLITLINLWGVCTVGGLD